MPGKPDPDRPRAMGAWEEAFGSPPPPYLSVAFMCKAVAYEAQCKASGGLPSSVRRSLRQIAEGKPVADAGDGGLRSGSHLVREWNGRTYQVEVVEGGYRIDGKDWASLSAIAKHITGTTWSGPRFFGLTRRAASGR
ncbi:DUF2924 domain-containing protein [Roseobacter litoralis]|uniref:Bacteriophage-like protein n=1 Tax=Roseobacter litoralis (strain ATCC 49566 / DSM 6996 / JCM 21268 / NBRC 15278 / OCh 149) TaxID=391595 RepID=F7ZFD7_ROSLO|nr:DUF2924 domain-containing protein [Roseobacter litoralis]AEI94760.1 hypothetical protein RLO149_c028005 [Roseobacter litoralis Och 149]